jgi:hypothetical protein
MASAEPAAHLDDAQSGPQRREGDDVRGAAGRLLTV